MAGSRAGVRGTASFAVSVVVLCLVGEACGSTPSAPSPSAASTSPSLQSVTLSANLSAVSGAGQTAQTTATGVFSKGSSQDVTATCTNWQSANAGVLTVTSTGMLTVRGDGSSAVTTTCQGVAARVVLTITLKSASPSPFSPSGTITDGFSGGILPNIYVQVTAGTNHGRYTRSDTAGNYRLDGLSAGTFTLTISAVTYVTTDESMTLSADTRLDVVLPRAPRMTPSDGTYPYRLVLTMPAPVNSVTRHSISTACLWSRVTICHSMRDILPSRGRH
jgi:hypothetical protein